MAPLTRVGTLRLLRPLLLGGCGRRDSQLHGRPPRQEALEDGYCEEDAVASSALETQSLVHIAMFPIIID